MAVVQGELLTLGRGGSDYTASLIAQAIDADSLTLLKVDGLMTADLVMLHRPDRFELHYRSCGACVLRCKSITPSKYYSFGFKKNTSFRKK